MNSFVLLSRQEHMAQRGAVKHDQWRGYMAVLVVNHGNIKSFTILNAEIRPIIKFDVDKPRDCFPQEVKWTLAICAQLSTLSGLHLDRVPHLPHTLR